MMLTATDQADKTKRTMCPIFPDREARLFAGAASSAVPEEAGSLIKPGKPSIFIVMLLSLPCGMVLAGPVQPPLPDGKALAEACFSCHGEGGRGGGRIPALAGQDMTGLQQKMLALRSPSPGSTIMPRLMRGYDTDEIAALADYFAGVSP
ncbi:c-type cytochrome [Pseudogemmobacter humi]|uniref:c-type cytochrome n=1 Tax=Pseudogemmobacter humi TaxID=2483812 RepID=UPI000F53A48B